MTRIETWFAYLLTLFPHPYFVPFLGAVIGGEETILVISALAAQGAMSFGAVLSMSYLGTLVSDALWFLFGQRGTRWLDARPSIHARMESIAQLATEVTRGRYFLTMIISKFLYGTRIITIFYIARQGVSLWQFTVYNMAATGIWVVVVCGIGWLAGQGILWAEHTFGNVTIAITILAAFIIGLYTLRTWVNKAIIEKNGHS